MVITCGKYEKARNVSSRICCKDTTYETKILMMDNIKMDLRGADCGDWKGNELGPKGCILNVRAEPNLQLWVPWGNENVEIPVNMIILFCCCF
jgi:hypothetical protein